MSNFRREIVGSSFISMTH
uniref:Uncharacterized protein n=1 Tax=Anguilla anguilla TaxID=7936 RepID=A0A0E9PIV0_ANGAN